MQRKGSRQITVVDTPYMQYDIALQIETPYLYCPHCAKYAVVRPQCIHHPKRCMTLRLMGHIARLMQETSARLLSGILRLSQSSILREDKDILTLIDEVRRALCKSLEENEKKLIKGKRYLFLCGEENLDDDKREELDKLLQMNQPLQEAYLLKEKLMLVFQFPSFKKSATAFGEWIALAEASTLKPFKRLSKTLSRNAQQVLNFFRFRLTSGRIEGMNSMISCVQLKTRGLPSVDYLRLKLRHLTSPSFTLLF